MTKKEVAVVFLKTLIQEGFVRKQGEGKATTYQLTMKDHL